MRKIVLVTLGLFLQSQMVMAQKELTLKEAIGYALQNKAEARKAALNIDNSEFMIQEARANALPQINGSASLTHNILLQEMAMNMGGQTIVIKMGQPWTSTAAVQLDQQIFNLAVFTGLKAAKTTREFYKINQDLTEEQIIEKVASSYFDIYKTKSQLNTLNKTLANTERVRNVIASLYENGLAKKIDLDRINVALNNLNSTKNQLTNALALQENSIKYLIGMNITESIVIPEQEMVVDYKKANREPIDVNNRTEIKLLHKQKELLQYNKQAINAARYPSLALTSNYGYYGLGEKFPYFAGKDQGVNWSDFSAVGLNLRVPLFAGFANRSKVRQAQNQIDQLEVDIRDTELGLQLSADNAYTQIKNALLTLSSQEANQKLAKEVLDNVENNYKNGLASLTDLLDAETSFADAQNNYTNAMVEYKLAEIQLEKAKGNLVNTYYPEKR